MIPLLRQAARRAFMPTVGKFLRNILTAGACLACALRIDGHDLRTSLVCYMRQDAHELAPGDIRDCPVQLVILEHPLDVQALHNDEAEGKDQTASDLIVMLAALVGDARMNGSQMSDGLATVGSAFLLAGDGAANPAQFGQGVFQVARVGLLASVRVGQEIQPGQSWHIHRQ